jgi:hypothetical protein
LVVLVDESFVSSKLGRYVDIIDTIFRMVVCIKFNPRVGNMAVPHCGPKVLNNATVNAACISPSNHCGIKEISFFEFVDAKYGRN